MLLHDLEECQSFTRVIETPNFQGERREASPADVRFVSKRNGCLRFVPPCWLGVASPGYGWYPERSFTPTLLNPTSVSLPWLMDT